MDTDSGHRFVMSKKQHIYTSPFSPNRSFKECDSATFRFLNELKYRASNKERDIHILIIKAQ